MDFGTQMGLIQGLGEGLKSGIQQYQQGKEYQRQQAKDEFQQKFQALAQKGLLGMHGFEQDQETGDVSLNAAGKQQAALKAKAEKDSLRAKLTGSFAKLAAAGVQSPEINDQINRLNEPDPITAPNPITQAPDDGSDITTPSSVTAPAISGGAPQGLLAPKQDKNPYRSFIGGGHASPSLPGSGAATGAAAGLIQGDESSNAAPQGLMPPQRGQAGGGISLQPIPGFKRPQDVQREASRNDHILNTVVPKMAENFGKALDPHGSRAGNFGTVGKKYLAGQGLKALINQYPNADSRQMQEIAMGLASMLSPGGAATVDSVKHLVPHTALGSIKGVAEWILNDPQGADQQKFVKRMEDTVDREMEVSKRQMVGIMNKRLPMFRRLKELDPDTYNATYQAAIDSLDDMPENAGAAPLPALSDIQAEKQRRGLK